MSKPEQRTNGTQGTQTAMRLRSPGENEIPAQRLDNRDHGTHGTQRTRDIDVAPQVPSESDSDDPFAEIRRRHSKSSVLCVPCVPSTETSSTSKELSQEKKERIEQDGCVRRVPSQPDSVPDDPFAEIRRRHSTASLPPRAEAKSLIRTCREYGIGLRLDPDGTLVVTSNGAAWRALVDEIEAHVDDIAELVAANWDSTDA
jgi:hypothetical protein